MHFDLGAVNEALFWSKVDKSGECWLWTGRLFTQTGYGLFSVRCDDGKWKPTTAHRVSYRLSVGEIPDRFHVDHLCCVRACVRPEHLEAVTQRVNILRGTSPAAVAARRTTCAKGHPYTPENTYLRPSGRRECRTCMRAYDENRVRSSGRCAFCGDPFTSNNTNIKTCSRSCRSNLIWQKRRSTT